MKLTIRAFTLPVLSFEYRFFPKLRGAAKILRDKQLTQVIEQLVPALNKQPSPRPSAPEGFPSVEAKELADTAYKLGVRQGRSDAEAETTATPDVVKQALQKAYERGLQEGLAAEPKPVFEAVASMVVGEHLELVREDDGSTSMVVDTSKGRFRVETGPKGDAVVRVSDDHNGFVLWNSASDADVA